MTRLEEMKDMDRVPLLPDFPNDLHNRIAGLLDMIHDCFTESSVIVEIGTGLGVSTEVFALTVGLVHTCDPYFEDGLHWRDKAVEVCSRYPIKITQHIDFSENVCKLFPDRSVDGVYIDGAHQYKPVYDDIVRWLPKIKTGGWVTGHDHITDKTRKEKYGFGVIEAVRDALGGPDKTYSDSSWVKRVI